MSDHFRNVWSYLDQDATGFIFVEQFPQLMIKLGLPLGWDESYIDTDKKPETYIKAFSIPIIDECKLKFTDVLEELVMIAAINEEIKKYIRSKITCGV